MNRFDVFVSVGGTATKEQETFVCAVEERLRSEGLIPHTVGRNTFSADAPLKTVTGILDSCTGTVVIALERKYFPAGVEKRGGPNETQLTDVKYATPWNQIEAAMAYSRGHPLMVIAEQGITAEGLLEPGYDWYVQTVIPEPAALNTAEFNGVLASWKAKLSVPQTKSIDVKKTTEITIGEIVGNMRPTQLWSLLGAIFALVAGAFALGGRIISG